MFQRHSVTVRIGIGKTIGFVVGLIVFFTLPATGAEVSTMFLFGLWFTYIMMGAMIGLMGIMTEHPVLKFKMPFWVRGAVVGIGFHLLVVLLAYDSIAAMMDIPFIAWFGVRSPFWMLIDGAVLGIIMSYVATKVSGEGNLPLK